MKNLKEQFLFLISSILSTVINGVRSPLKKEEISKILVVKLDEIGDMIYALHIFQSLRKAYPNAQIDVVCKSMNYPLVQNTNSVSNCYSKLSDIDSKYDGWIELRGTFQSIFKSIFKTHYLLDRGSHRIYNKLNGGQIHEKDINLAIISDLLEAKDRVLEPILAEDEASHQILEFIKSQSNGTEYVVIHCGARDEQRRWPATRFAEIIDVLNLTYNLTVVLVGSSSESEIVDLVITHSKAETVNLCGKTTLMELNSIIKHAKLFIGNESGPMHFAVVNKIPLIALFGPGVPDVFYPYYPKQKVIHYFDQSLDNKTLETSTILKISVNDVTQEAKTLLSL
jgi:ADP-heptose:LPS heptosyltransferase